jgi:secreted trypsin-like serine protease
MSLKTRFFGFSGFGATVATVAVSSVLALGISGPAFAAAPAALSDVSATIVGGQEATIADAPWQVALISASASDEYNGQFCGGSLIATQWVATAAHCVVSNGSTSPASSLKILAGQATLSQVSNSRAVSVSNIYVHPLYSSAADTDDIALIKLTTPLTLVAGSIQKIDLPTSAPALGGPALITGWGSLAFGSNNYPTVLRKATVDILADATCNASYSPGYNATKMLCAGSPALDRDTCQGDSGGPLARLGVTWVLHGITSFGNGCANGADPGVYTEVFTYLSWINQYIGTGVAPTPNPIPTPTITLTGALSVGQTLTAAAGTWSPTPDSFRYVWKRGSSATTANWTTISGQSGNTYALSAADRGKFIRVEVTGIKAGSSPTTAAKVSGTAIAAGTFATTATPTITGTLKVRSTLTANEGTWTPRPDSFTYSWMSSSTAGGNYTAISGATAKTYTLKPADRNRFIKVVITAVKAGYTTSAQFTSGATARIG